MRGNAPLSSQGITSVIPFFCLNITMAYSGRYKIKNKHKYIGDPTNVWYRSSWECHYMSWLDKTDAVLEWKSEEIVIPYISPVDGRPHRYFPDFWVKVKTDRGIKEFLVEIKPESQVLKPKVPKRKTRQYMEKMLTWMVNKEKWANAQLYAEMNGMEFKVLTEKHLGLDYKYKGNVKQSSNHIQSNKPN